jgi:serine/threonine-protein kinase HipA
VEADLATTDRNMLWGRQFLNTFAFHDLAGENAALVKLANPVRSVPY